MKSRPLCLFYGPDKTPKRMLAKELKAPLDALKHGTLPNQEIIAGVRKQIVTAP